MQIYLNHRKMKVLKLSKRQDSSNKSKSFTLTLKKTNKGLRIILPQDKRLN